MVFRRALAWSVYGQSLSHLIFFVGSVIVARLLTPYEMGVFAIAMATIGILNTLVAFNVGTYVIREKELLPSTLDSAFTLNGLLACAITASIYTASLVVEYYLKQADVARVLAVLAVAPLLGVFEFRPTVMFQKNMNFRVLALIGIGKTIVTTISVVSLVVLGFSFMSLAYSSIICGVFGVVLTNILGREYASFSLSFSESRKIAVFGLRMMMIGGVASIAARISDIILGQALGLAALGLYARASSISTLIFENVYGAVTRVIFVQLSNDYRETGSVRRMFLRSFEIIIALFWPMQIGLAILAGPAIYTLYGEKWLGATLPLSLLMVAQCVVLCFGMNWELFVLRDETARQVRFEAVRAVVGVITFSIGCLFSISAAAIGRIAEAVFGLILYQPHMSRMAETKPGEFARIFMNGIGLTTSAVLPSLVLMTATGWSHHTSLPLIVGAILMGVLFWLAVLSWQKHPLLHEIRSLVGNFLPQWALRSKSKFDDAK